MEFILEFLGLFAWSVLCFISGAVFAANKSVEKFIKLFDREKLKAAYIGDEEDIKNHLK
jgi:hypothetical protein